MTDVRARGPYDCRNCGKPVPPHERPNPRDAKLFAMLCDSCLRANQTMGSQQS